MLLTSLRPTMEDTWAETFKTIIDYGMNNGLGMYLTFFAAVELAIQTALILMKRGGNARTDVD
jgi:hypothetical protein